MTLEEFANKLNGNQYREEITKELVEQAGQYGFVVMFGYSDDNVELRGAIDDAVGACNGTDVFFNKGNVVQLEEPFDDLDEQMDFLKKYGIRLDKKKVSAIWDEQQEFVWSFKTDIEHATFDIFEDDDPFCKGIVFHISSVA